MSLSIPGQVAIPPQLSADAVESALQELVKALGVVADMWAAHKAVLAAALADAHAQALADLHAVQTAQSIASRSGDNIPRSSDSDLP